MTQLDQQQSATQQRPGSGNPTVHELRRRWKPQKERLHAQQPDHPLTIRFHRACSWMARTEAMTDDADLDLKIINQWIALNALYGRWDERANQPLPDHECWRGFFDQIKSVDEGKRIAGVLQDHKKLVLSLLDDPYVSKYFWQEPTAKRAGKSRKAKYDALTWYVEGNWTMILDRLIERIYLVRCQLIHGAATYDGKLNRTAVRRCATMMGHLLPAVLTVITDHGADEDWGPMCYPPL